MKIRNDYITNSSSSSFILSFKNEKSIYNTLKNQFTKFACDNTGYLYQLLKEIESAERLTKDDVIKIMDDEGFSIEYKLEGKLFRENNMLYSESEKFFETKEGKQMIDAAYREEVNRVMKEIGDDKVIVQVEHGDGGYGEDGILENKILPNLNCMKIKFSHH